MGSCLTAAPKRTSLRGKMPSSKSVHRCGLGATGRIKLKRYAFTKKPKHLASHVLAETTHDVAAPRDGFTCVVTPATYYSKSVRGFGDAGGGSKFGYSNHFGCWLCDNSKTMKQNRQKIAPIAFQTKLKTSICTINSVSFVGSKSPCPTAMSKTHGCIY